MSCYRLFLLALDLLGDRNPVSILSTCWLFLLKRKPAVSWSLFSTVLAWLGPRSTSSLMKLTIWSMTHRLLVDLLKIYWRLDDCRVLQGWVCYFTAVSILARAILPMFKALYWLLERTYGLILRFLDALLKWVPGLRVEIGLGSLNVAQSQILTLYCFKVLKELYLPSQEVFWLFLALTGWYLQAL